MDPIRFAPIALALGVVGCSLLNPSLGAGSVWWEENPTAISYVAGPATASVGRPVELTARVIIGSGSCDRYQDLKATVEPASRSVRLSATRESKRSSGVLQCTGDYGARLATVSVTLPATGSYRVYVESFLGVAFAPDESPRATIDLWVSP